MWVSTRTGVLSPLTPPRSPRHDEWNESMSGADEKCAIGWAPADDFTHDIPQTSWT
jgi:hypothetical protein